MDTVKHELIATETEVVANVLTLWRDLEARSALQCPVCRSVLHVTDQQFACASCKSAYPVESGVPLLMRPDQVESIPDQVASFFNLPPSLKDRVAAALTTLTKYRTHSHPEFDNFFARFDKRQWQAQTLPLSVDETQAAIGNVECLTHHFPKHCAPTCQSFDPSA